MSGDSLKNLISSEAKKLGFSSVGFSKAEFLEEEAPRLEKWLNNNMHGEMSWMENHFDKRLDPRVLVPGAKSVVSLLLNYFPDKQQADNLPKISKYAYGEDYHFVIKDKLKLLINTLRQSVGDINARVFVDSAPVMDKVWAQKAGLGWIGKNSNLITKQNGSFFFIAEIVSDLDLPADSPIRDYCGTCTACIDECPTDAIVQPYMVDGSKCISYFTIELKNQIPQEFKSKLDDWVFGCDICQDVCPWNRFSTPHNESRFQPTGDMLNLNARQWMEMTEDVFEIIARNSPLQRPGLDLVKRNVQSAFGDDNAE